MKQDVLHKTLSKNGFNKSKKKIDVEEVVEKADPASISQKFSDAFRVT